MSGIAVRILSAQIISFEPHNSVFHTADYNSLLDLEVNLVDLEKAFFLNETE